ncbi:MAG: glycoside hydrolase family 95 protein [Saprospiraceae bacterium]|nr:glycoside hydrolase family 95 protein [Saprospiraceae bacterium]
MRNSFAFVFPGLQKTVPCLIFLASLFGSGPSYSQSDHKLWYEEPASFFEETLMLGNGKLGATIFGGVAVDSIFLNDATLWSGEPVDPHMNPEAHVYVPQIRDALSQKKFALADSLQRKMQGSFSQSYAPLGTCYIEMLHATDSVHDYYRELDIRDGISKVNYMANGVKYEREYLASYPDQIMAIHLRASEAGALDFNIHFRSLLKYQLIDNYNVLEVKGYAPVHAEPSYRGDMPNAVIFKEGKGTQFTTFFKIIPEGGVLVSSDQSVGIRGGTGAVILISIATSFNGFDKNPATEGKDQRKEAYTQLRNASAKTYLKIREDHIRDFHYFFNRVQFSLGESQAPDLPTDQRLQRYAKGGEDKKLEVLYFQFGRYLLISSSRTDGVPANLQGIWNPYLRPPWSSNYTMNINLEENYWPAEVTNLSELHRPLLSFIENLSQTGKITAETFYGVGGWAAAHNSDIWAMSNPVGDFGQGHPSWANWNMAGAWLSTHLWEHFVYNQDLNYLKDFAYPIMYGAAKFCLDWLTENENGNLITSPSTSPENLFVTPDGYVGATLAGGTADLAMIRECFRQCIKAAEILQVDEEFKNGLSSVLDRLYPYQVGKKGNLQEWYEDWEDHEPTHRHQSHLFGLYPGHHITPEKTPDLAAAAKRTLELKGDESTGWSKGWRINLWARLWDGNHAYAMYRTLLKYVEPDGKVNYAQGGGTYPNLWDAHPPFQIDGNFGGTAGVAEMLLQSSENEIHLLPALPDAWPEGVVRGLCARGGFVVDLEWENGNLSAVTVKSEKGGETTLLYQGKKMDIDLRPGRFRRITWKKYFPRG